MNIRGCLMAGWGMLSGIVLLSCSSGKTNQPHDVHSSRSSVDWAGSYQGVIPCADCEGIRTIVQLNQDHTYQLYQKYLGKDADPQSTVSTFSWSSDGRSIVLKAGKNAYYLQVGENRLFWLDQKKKRIKGTLENHYILRKYENDVTEKYWKLKELSGIPVTVTGNREAHFILKQDNKFIGNGGCNAISGTYELKRPGVISFARVASTEMACAALKTEHKFVEVLQQTNAYSLLDDTLYLKKGIDTLARFEVVYLR